MKSKKGFTFETRTTIILLIVLAVSAMVMYSMIENVSKTASYSACHDSIFALEWSAKQFPAGKYYAKEFPSVCNPEHIIIEEEDKEAVKEKILGLMDRCFWTYGEGKFFPFDKDAAQSMAQEINDFLGIQPSAAETLGHTSCAVCLTFEVPNLNARIIPDEIKRILMEQTTKDGNVFYNYFNYPEAAKVFGMKSASETGDPFGGVMVKSAIQKGTIYSINFVSAVKGHSLSHPTIDTLGEYSKYCYPR